MTHSMTLKGYSSSKATSNVSHPDTPLNQQRPKVDKERLAQALDVFAEADQYDKENVRIEEDQRHRWIHTNIPFIYTRESIYYVVESFGLGFMRTEIDDFIDSVGEVQSGTGLISLCMTDFE